MKIIKELGLNKLPSIFNKISITIESQQLAVNNLIEKIIISKQYSINILQYILYKISLYIILDCQTDHYNEMDEGHSLKLARVINELCDKIKDLSRLVKGQFYKFCPLCIPKIPESGLHGTEFLLDMGFKLEVFSEILFLFDSII